MTILGVEGLTMERRTLYENKGLEFDDVRRLYLQWHDVLIHHMTGVIVHLLP